jgi:hypothetical protein
MTNNELQAACEMAGMRYVGEWDEWGMGEYVYKSHDPALPAYVASLLVAQVAARDHEAGAEALVAHIFNRLLWKFGLDVLATDEQRIAAAMEVLS